MGESDILAMFISLFTFVPLFESGASSTSRTRFGNVAGLGCRHLEWLDRQL
jgi:hypothetical protein